MNEHPTTPPTLTIIRSSKSASVQFQRYDSTPSYPVVMSTMEMEQQYKALVDLIERTIQSLYHFYPGQGSAGDERDQSIQLKQLGEQIYELLPKPIRTAIEQATANMPRGAPFLVATNDNQIPWELAWDGQHYWGLRWSLSRIFMRTDNEDVYARPGAAITEKYALLIGNPTGDLTNTSNELDALCDSLAAIYKLKLLAYSAATKSQILRELRSGRYSLIHYAGHAVVLENGEGALLLHDNEQLAAAEIKEALRGNPWVILNACASAQSNPNSFLVQADMSLAQAFITGGAAVVMATMWPVPDQGSYELINALYRKLLQGAIVSHALTSARNIVYDSHPADPVWATYVLYAPPHLRLIEDEPYEKLPFVTVLHVRLNIQTSKLSPEKRAQVHDEVVTFIIDQVRNFGGQVVQQSAYHVTVAFGIVPEYGIPQRFMSDDQTESALSAALAIHQTLPGLFAAQPRFKFVTPLVTIGLAADSGVLNRKNNHLTSRAVEIATWLGERALSGEILVEQNVMLNARQRYRTESWSCADLLPKPASLDITAIQKVTGSKSERTFGHLIGRSDEMQALMRGWQPVQKGQTSVMILVGEAGVGKSHIVHEFRRWLNNQTTNSIYIQCIPQAVETEFFLLATILRSALKLRADTDPNLVRTAVSARVATIEHISPSLHEYTTDILCMLMGANQKEREIKFKNERDFGEKLIMPLTKFCKTLAPADHVLALVLEDLHYADQASLAVLCKVLENCKRLPIFCLAVQRPATQIAWPKPTPIDVNRFDQDGVAALIRTQFKLAFSDETTAQIAHWTGGNPFFVIELTKMLLDYQFLSNKEGIWQLQRPLSEAMIPRTIQGIIQNRVGTLELETRHLLEELAVLGPKFPVTVGMNMLKRGSDRTQRAIAMQIFDLEQSEWLGMDSSEMYFPHELVHAGVLQRISNRKCRNYHLRAARVWSEADASSDQIVSARAHHFYQSICETDGENEPMVSLDEVNPTDVNEAIAAQIQAGEQAEKQYAYPSAIIYYQRAQELCQLAGKERSAVADLARRIGRLHTWRAQHEAALTSMQQGLQMLGITNGEFVHLASVDERCTAARIMIHIASTYYSQGAYRQAQTHCMQGLEILEQVQADQPDRDIAEGNNVLGAILDAQGKSREALRHYQHSQQIWQALGDLNQLNRSRGNMASALFYLGQWDEALTLDMQAFSFWEASGDLRRKGLAALNIGTINMYRGEWNDANQYFEIGKIACASVEDQRHLALAYTNLGWLQLALGQYEQAEGLFAQSQEILKQHHIFDSAEPLCGLSDAALRKGDTAKALEFATNAVKISRDSETRNEECLAHRYLAAGYLATEQISVAERALIESLDIAKELEFRFEEGRTLLALGALYAQTKRKADGVSSIENASTIFSTLRSGPLLQQAMTIRKELSALE